METDKKYGEIAKKICSRYRAAGVPFLENLFAEVLRDTALQAQREMLERKEIKEVESCLRGRSSGCRCTPERGCLSCRCKKALASFAKLKESVNGGKS